MDSKYFKRKPRRCPNCGHSPLANIMYGYPIESEELNNKIEKGLVAIGGCCIGGLMAKWKCSVCEKEFYKITKHDAYIKYTEHAYMENETTSLLYEAALAYKGLTQEPSNAFSLDSTKLKRFIDLCEEIDVWSWKSEYRDPNIIDGYEWELELNLDGKYYKGYGINQAPKEMDALLLALEELFDSK